MRNGCFVVVVVAAVIEQDFPSNIYNNFESGNFDEGFPSAFL